MGREAENAEGNTNGFFGSGIFALIRIWVISYGLRPHIIGPQRCRRRPKEECTYEEM